MFGRSFEITYHPATATAKPAARGDAARGDVAAAGGSGSGGGNGKIAAL
jgi:hypothetical protein